MIEIHLPEHISSPLELAEHLKRHADRPIDELASQIVDVLDEHEEVMDDMHRLRDVLVGFGALEESDTTTGLLDLLEVLLPAAEA